MFNPAKNIYNSRFLLKSMTEISRRNASYHIDNTTTLTSSHEQAQANPLLGKINKVFQHPFIGRRICAIDPECKHKLCDTPCGIVKENSYVGHGTHSDSEKLPGVVSLGEKDFKGDDRPQFAVLYPKPISNDDVQGTQVNNVLTKNLNENQVMKEAIHTNCSKKTVATTEDDING